MGMKYLKRWSALATIALSSTASTQTTNPADPWRKVSAAIEASMKAAKFPAVTAAVVRNGRVEYLRGFGLSDIENATPADGKTVYRTASVAKPITAAAVMQLVEAGRVDLAASIRKYVPSLPATYDRVSITDLLRHTGGVRHYKDDAEYLTTRHCDRLSDALPIFASDPLDHGPGEKFTYSSWGYTLLGLAIERVSGLSYPEYIRSRIFQPAGMASSRVDTLQIIPHRAAGYTTAENGTIRNADLLDTSCRIPAGGFVSTAGDLARFSVALQNGTLMKRETMRGMMRPGLSSGAVTRSLVGLKVPAGYVFPGIGFGWQIENKEGLVRVNHGGNQPGVTTMLYQIPARGLAVVLLTNLDSKGVEITALAEAITNAVPN